MNQFAALAIVLALFSLRFVMPLVITLAFGFLMNRVYARWQFEGDGGILTNDST